MASDDGGRFSPGAPDPMDSVMGTEMASELLAGFDPRFNVNEAVFYAPIIDLDMDEVDEAQAFGSKKDTLASNWDDPIDLDMDEVDQMQPHTSREQTVESSWQGFQESQLPQPGDVLDEELDLSSEKDLNFGSAGQDTLHTSMEPMAERSHDLADRGQTETGAELNDRVEILSETAPEPSDADSIAQDSKATSKERASDPNIDDNEQGTQQKHEDESNHESDRLSEINSEEFNHTIDPINHNVDPISHEEPRDPSSDTFNPNQPPHDDTWGPMQLGSGKLEVVDVESWILRDSFTRIMNDRSEHSDDPQVKSEHPEPKPKVQKGAPAGNLLDWLAPNNWTRRSVTPKTRDSAPAENAATSTAHDSDPEDFLKIKQESQPFKSSLFEENMNSNAPIHIFSSDDDDTKTEVDHDELSGDNPSAQIHEGSTANRGEGHNLNTSLRDAAPIMKRVFLSKKKVKPNLYPTVEDEGETDGVANEAYAAAGIAIEEMVGNVEGQPSSRDPAPTMKRVFLAGKKSKRNLNPSVEEEEEEADELANGADRASGLSIEEMEGLVEDPPDPKSAPESTAVPAKSGSSKQAKRQRPVRTAADIANMQAIRETNCTMNRQNRKKSKLAEVRVPQVSTASSTSEPQDQSTTEPPNPHAWQYENLDESDENENEAAAARFSALKKNYLTKKRANKLSTEEEIDYIRAEKQEAARLKRLELEALRAAAEENQSESNPAGSENQDEDGLFVSTNVPTRSPSKRPYVEDESSTDDDEIIGNARKRLKPSSSGKRLTNSILHNSMLAGLEAEIEKQKKKDRSKKKAAAKRKAKAAGKAASQKKKGSKKAQDGNESDFDPSAATKAKALAKSRSKKAAKRTVTLLQDPNTLLTSNIFEDANAGLEAGTIPLMTDAKKADALKQLIAAVPLEDQRFARREKDSILKATIELGRRKVKPDGNGGWAFKGMRTSLKNHQVQGAAWMRTRETGNDEPLGGLVADEMGFGKTLQMLACMISNPPPPNENCKATLLVVPNIIAEQWAEEIEKHVVRGALGQFHIHYGKYRIGGPGAVDIMQRAGVILTTYSEIISSYPSFKPPKEYTTYAQKEKWWAVHYNENRGLLHRVRFYRVVLDEAQSIKNRMSQTSIACRALQTKHRWAMSGTPIQNSVEELYPYFRFLHVRNTGSFEVFKENFCDKESGFCNGRLQSFLKQFLIRRTHADRIFGVPLISLPRNHHVTVALDFNSTERSIYEIVRQRCIARINQFRKRGILKSMYANVFTMLLRLRQLTAHPFLLQDCIGDLFELQDVDNLWIATASETETTVGQSKRDMLTSIRKIIEGQNASNKASNQPPTYPADDAEFETSQPLVFKFRKYLRQLAESSKWDDIARRSLCNKCRDSPIDPYLTDCLHLYCKECLKTMALEAAQDGEDSSSCLECGKVYDKVQPCQGLQELAIDKENAQVPRPSTTRSRRKEEDEKWINICKGSMLPSTKTAAMVAQIEAWLKNDPKCKIIVFTQWQLMIRIVKGLCEQRGWGACTLYGKQHQKARDKTIRDFRNKKELKIMVASLKCGGVGLNLTCASRVICIDLWWNSYVEQQAFCRVFRIGQLQETFITRFVVKNTVDDMLQELQEQKKESIDAAIGDDGKRLAKLSLGELLRMFGPVTGEDGKEFILVDDEDDYAHTGIPPPPGHEEAQPNF